jgi:proline racemase
MCNSKGDAMSKLSVSVTEYHTAGEPFRIVTGGIGPIRGSTILEKRRFAQENLDHVRSMVINEPRGHADMYGCFLTDPEDDGASFGTLFFHNDGYSTACGHGTIALATWAVDSGIVALDKGAGDVSVAIDVPSGRVHAVAHTEDGRVRSVGFHNVPSFVHAEHIPIKTPYGEVLVDIAFGGAFYGIVDVEQLGMEVKPENISYFVEQGRLIKDALSSQQVIFHPDRPEIRDIYGVIFFQREGASHDGRLCQRNVTIFANGELDRSPCGSGTSARLALLTRRGELSPGAQLLHRSIIGTEFIGKVIGETDKAGVLTEVTGSAYLTGVHHFFLERDDPLVNGFLLR